MDFAAIAALGVKTIISVDGAIPDIEAAKAAGLEYYHVPIGYNAVPLEATAALNKIFKEQKGSFYVHCHHGQNRAPAVVAAALKAAGVLKNDEALDLMRKAGTANDYTGLWQSVEACGPESIAGINPELYHQAPVAPLAEIMAGLDGHWDLLNAYAKAGWKVLDSYPDITPQHEALMVWEFFKRLQEESPKKEGAAFKELLGAAIDDAESLHRTLQGEDSELRQKYLDRLGQNCKSCHTQFRN
jgi:protein tyrosine phosphatase (PTP) superfamily phosphohydrolase (DUF442 family)